jgi:hypothetical protein
VFHPRVAPDGRWMVYVARDGSRFFFPLRLQQPEANVIHVRTGAWANQAGAH